MTFARYSLVTVISCGQIKAKGMKVGGRDRRVREDGGYMGIRKKHG